MSVVLHANCIRLGTAGAAFGAAPDAGVLLLGASGAGKSSLTLKLIAMGADLVADDRTEIFAEAGGVWGRPLALGAGLIEVRGVGIVRLAHVEKVRIALVVSLEPGERLPARRRWPVPDGIPNDLAPPWIALEADDIAATKIALAVAAFEHNLHRDGVNTI